MINVLIHQIMLVLLFLLRQKEIKTKPNQHSSNTNQGIIHFIQINKILKILDLKPFVIIKNLVIKLIILDLLQLIMDTLIIIKD